MGHMTNNMTLAAATITTAQILQWCADQIKARTASRAAKADA